MKRMNYRVADNIDYLDGDQNSSWNFSSEREAPTNNSSELSERERRVYNFGGSTLISNRSRVYKGGGWDDRAYYLIPGTRRFLDERQSSASIGFRCAMDRMGTAVPYSGQ
jgi:formylglycine-generating enzyme required for sulfatase activity